MKMKTIRSKASTKEALLVTVDELVKLNIAKSDIVTACTRIFTLDPLERMYLNDTINACLICNAIENDKEIM
jgi:hypothetical protein